MTKVILLTDSLARNVYSADKGIQSVTEGVNIKKRFTSKESSALGKELVGFIDSFRRGNRYKPLEKDVVYISLKQDAAQSTLCIEKPNRKNLWGNPYSVVVTDTVPADNKGVFPLSLDGLKRAIGVIRKS